MQEYKDKIIHTKVRGLIKYAYIQGLKKKSLYCTMKDIRGYKKKIDMTVES